MGNQLEIDLVDQSEIFILYQVTIFGLLKFLFCNKVDLKQKTKTFDVFIDDENNEHLNSLSTLGFVEFCQL